MARKRHNKRSQPASQNPLRRFVKQGKRDAEAGRYPEAIAAYEAALDLLRQDSKKVRKRYEWLWLELAELYVRVNQVDRAQTLYQEYLTTLLNDGRIKRFRNAISASHEMAGTDLDLDLISVFRKVENLCLIHQLPSPILDELFSQAIEAHESNPDPFAFTLISELLPRVDVKPPGASESLESRLMQPNGLTEVLEGLQGDVSSPVPAPATLPSIDEDERRQELYEIWMDRVQGTWMYRGAGYGVRTAISFLLDMLDDSQGIAQIEIEGIEDFDVYYHDRTTSPSPQAFPPRVYVQAKSRGAGQPAWSISQLQEVLNNFAEVHCADPAANFLFLTDYHFGERTTLSGILGYPHLWAFDQDHSIRDDVLRVLDPDFVADERFDLETFLKRIHFRQMERDLEYRLVERLANLTETPKGVAVRFYEALFEEVHKLAEAAKTDGVAKAFSKPELERFLHEVISSVDVSAIEAPLRRGNLELLTFRVAGETPPPPDPNYYLGVYADIRHILADQDIPRPELMEELAIRLVQRNFCVLRSPSGTGKTTLMYRFAYEHRHSFTIYRLRRLDGDSEVIEECVRYIKSLQPTERSPVLLLIDDISRPGKRGWQEFLKPVLENPNVYVVATSREDEWSDFLARGINVEYVHLSLSEETARRFHQLVKERDQLHPDYPDWREAYVVSKTNGTALFMEYAHILTRGRRIQEVLDEQVERIASKPARDATIQLNLLRSICTAHAFGGRVPADVLPDLINVHDETLHPHLRALADEHLLIVREEDHYIGLHEVRSQFLRDLTHQYSPPSLQETLKQLITYLPLHELTPIVEGMCRDFPELAAKVLDALALRLNQEGEKLTDVAEMIRRLYMASEWHYARRVKGHLDQYAVSPNEVRVFAVVLTPTSKDFSHFLEMEVFRAGAREAFATAPARDSHRFERQIGSKMDETALAAKIDGEDNVATLVYFLNWLQEVDPTLAERVVAGADVEHLVTLVRTETSGQRAASLLFHVWRSNPAVYKQLTTALGGQQAAVDKLLASYPLIAKVDWDDSAIEGGAIHLYFWAEDPIDELADEDDVHTKTVFLAGVARRMFPSVARVRTTGLFGTGREYKLGMYDPATKNMPVENFVVLEDVEKNRIWLRAIAAQYTSKTWYAYLEQQDSLRLQYMISLNLMAALLQTVQKPRLRFPTADVGSARLLASYQSLLFDESKALPLPPDPKEAFLDLHADRDMYRDPDELIHDRLLQGLYHRSPHEEADADRYFRNYIGAIYRCVQFLCEYIVDGQTRRIRLLKQNAASALSELKRFHTERANLQLRQAEHADLSPLERHLVERVQKATKFFFDRDYEDLWQEAELLLKKIHLLANRLVVLQQELGQQENHLSLGLAQALSDELASTLPSIGILTRLHAELQDSAVTLAAREIQGHIQRLRSLTLLDCFVALAEQRHRELKSEKLKGIEDRLKSDGVCVTFGPSILKEDSVGVTEEILPILFHVSDLMDLQNKAPAIFRRIFEEEFDERQQFALVVTDGEAIVWPIIWTFAFWDRPRWDLAEEIDPSSFLRLCWARTDLAEQYSAHLDLPIAEDPEYIKAIQGFYHAAVEGSMQVARVREEVRLGRTSPEDAQRFLELEVGEGEESSRAESEGTHPLQAQIDFLANFEPPSGFEGYHVDVLKFVVELGNQLKCEIDALKQVIADTRTDMKLPTLSDMAIDSVAEIVEAGSSFQAEEEVRARLSAGEVVYEDMDIPSKFGLIYFATKNYFHFGRTEY